MDNRPPRGRKTSSGKRVDPALILFFLFLTMPYLQWFGIGLHTDVQPFSLVAAAVYLAWHFPKQLRRSGGIDRPLALLALAPIPIVLFSIGQLRSDPFAVARGLFGYVSIGLFTWAWVVLIRNHGPRAIVHCAKFSFWLWTIVGVLQRVDPHIGTLWRDKLIITNGRGALSLATEPAYFALAVLLLAITIAISDNSVRYILYALVVTLLVAVSAVGLIYGVVVLFAFTRVNVFRRFGALGVALVLYLIAIYFNPASRLAVKTKELWAGPGLLARTDQSFGLRVINIEYPIRGFFENHGLPHGLTQWYQYMYQTFVDERQPYSWTIEYVGQSSSGILSIHGQLLFELGFYGLIYYALFWMLIRRSYVRIPLAVVGFIMFMNGLTLNSPFLALVLAMAYVVGKHPAAGRSEARQGSQRNDALTTAGRA